ncbi:MAG: hypothetical protein C0506_08635 [Anaerolinea sp.]|nr:hypothetical protein [Anaerolinea sp.]
MRLVHPFPSFLVAGLTVALVRVADARAGAGLYAQLGLGMLLFQFAIGIANDVVDVEADAAAKPWKAIPRGVVSRRTATLGAAGCAGGGLLVTSTLETGPWLVGLAGLACGLSYDVYFKRTPSSWLPLAIALPLVPVWVFWAAGAWRGMLWWIFPLGAMLGLALHLANQAPDVAADRTVGVRGAAQRVGEFRARGIAVALFGVASTVAVVVLTFESRGAGSLAAVNAVFTALLAPRATALFGRDGLFGLLAGSTVVLAVVFLGAV